MQLRLEIQGLRALAVCAVTLFHAGFEWAQGGYLGVDVFFVISGFLITYSLLRRKENRKLGDFYIRRIRRLFPAFLVTVIATFAASYLIMSQIDFSLMAKSSFYAIFSVSNFGFLMEAGYWNNSSGLKPLLHTWSLSVEEQFYLTWPLLLIVLLKGGTRLVFGFMIALVIGGMFAAQHFTMSMPPAVFFLTPFRVYQFAIGGAYAAYLIMTDKTHITRGLLSDVFIILGSVLIIFPMVIYRGGGVYLGALAAIPCFGALLIIMAGPGRFVGLVYTNRVSAYLGLISYSLYLVHWPIMSLYSYIVLRDYTLPEQIAMIAASIILAVILYYGVESYFRKPVIRRTRQPLTGVKFGLASIFMSVSVGAVSVGAWLSGGFAKPFETPIADPIAGTERVLKDVRDERYQDFSKACNRDLLSCIKPSAEVLDVLVIGDSHAMDGYNIFRAALPNAKVHYAGRGGCAPLIGGAELHRRLGRSTKCDPLIDDILWSDDMLSQIDVIVYSFNWTYPKLSLLAATHKHLQTKTSAKFIMLGIAPNFDEPLPSIIRNRRLSRSNSTIPERLMHRNLGDLEARSKAFAIKKSMIYADRLGYFCPGGVCAAISPEGVLVSFDKHQLNYDAAVEFGAYLKRESILDSVE